MNAQIAKLKTGIKPDRKPITITAGCIVLRYYLNGIQKVEILEGLKATRLLVKAKAIDMEANGRLYIAGKRVEWESLKPSNEDYIIHLMAHNELCKLNEQLENAMYVGINQDTKHAA